MINPKSSSDQRSIPRRSFIQKPKNACKVWAELNPRTGSYRIFFGIPNSEVKTFAGAASSRSTLDYNIRKAEVKFGLRSLEG